MSQTKTTETVVSQLPTTQTSTTATPTSFGNSDLGLLIAFAMVLAVLAKILSK